MIWLTLIFFAALSALSIWGIRRYRVYREQRDLRIRYERLSRFCIIPQKGTKPVSYHHEDL